MRRTVTHIREYFAAAIVSAAFAISAPAMAQTVETGNTFASSDLLVQTLVADDRQEVDAALATLNTELAAAQGELATAGTAFAAAQETLTSASTALADSRATIDALKTELATTETVLATSTADLAAAKTELVTLQGQLTALPETDPTRATLITQIGALQTSIDTTLQPKVTELEGTLATITTQVGQLQATVDANALTVSTAQTDAAAAKAKLDSAQASVDDTQGKIDAAISSFNAEVAQIATVVDGLTDDQVQRINQKLNAAIKRGLIVNIDAEQLQAVLVGDFSKQQIDNFVKAFVEQARLLKKANKLMELAEKTGNDKFLVNAERARQQATLTMTKRFAKIERIAAKEAKETAKEAAKEAKDAAKEAAKEAKDAAKEAAKEAKDAAKEAAKEAKDAAKEAKDAAKAAAKEAKKNG
jgi:outer membrane murein-binding lipoprotein Lpp